MVSCMSLCHYQLSLSTLHWPEITLITFLLVSLTTLAVLSQSSGTPNFISQLNSKLSVILHISQFPPFNLHLCLLFLFFLSFHVYLQHNHHHAAVLHILFTISNLCQMAHPVHDVIHPSSSPSIPICYQYSRYIKSKYFILGRYLNCMTTNTILFTYNLSVSSFK